MKTKLLFTVILLLSFKTYSQIKYEKGYFINNNDEKTIFKNQIDLLKKIILTIKDDNPITDIKQLDL